MLASLGLEIEPAKTLSFRISRYGVISQLYATATCATATLQGRPEQMRTGRNLIACCVDVRLPTVSPGELTGGFETSSHRFADGFTVISRFLVQDCSCSTPIC